MVIHPLHSKLLVSPLKEASSSFSMETKKYDRICIGAIKASGPDVSGYEGITVVFDDSHSVDFSINGEQFSIIDYNDIVATIGEEE